MSFNDSNGLRVTETPELGPTMLRMDGAHNGPANELTLQWVLRELRLLREQQKALAAASELAAQGRFATHADLLERRHAAELADVGTWAEQRLKAERERHEALTALLIKSVSGVVQALGDLGGLTAASVVSQREAINALREDLERRSFGGRCRRFWTLLTGGWRG